MVRQREMKGLGHAILTGEVVGRTTSRLVYLLSDDLCLSTTATGVLAQMAATLPISFAAQSSPYRKYRKEEVGSPMV